MPITASIWPGSMARAAGAVTCASTFPTATAIPSRRPRWPAASGVNAPAHSPNAESGQSTSLPTKSPKSGLSARRYEAEGYEPSWKSPLYPAVHTLRVSRPQSCQTIQSAASIQRSVAS